LRYVFSYFSSHLNYFIINFTNILEFSDPINIKKEENKESKETNEKIGKEITEDKNLKDAQSPLSAQKISYPKLELEVYNSKSNQITDRIVITPNSITSSQGASIKALNDKFYFGRIPVGGSNLTNNKNDYNFSDDSIGNRQFEISFKDDKFYVIDNKKGTGLFVKIKDEVMVDHDMIVSFCASHMILQVENEKQQQATTGEKIIKIRFLQGAHQNKERAFSSKEKTIIRIGRSKEAEIVYKDDSVSRIQCTLAFESGEWILYDGQLENGSNKSSTNGLW
jgi:hypothetical protein